MIVLLNAIEASHMEHEGKNFRFKKFGLKCVRRARVEGHMDMYLVYHAELDKYFIAVRGCYTNMVEALKFTSSYTSARPIFERWVNTYHVDHCVAFGSGARVVKYANTKIGINELYVCPTGMSKDNDYSKTVIIRGNTGTSTGLSDAVLKKQSTSFDKPDEPL